MSECRDIEPLLAIYVDGVAPAPERASVEAHIEACPACCRRVAAERVARTVLVACRTSLQVKAPEGLYYRCVIRRQAAPAPPSRLPFTRWRWVPLSIGAVFVLALALAGAFVLSLNGNVDGLATQLALDHVKCFQVAGNRAPLDAASAGRQWAEAQGWTVEVPSSALAVQLELRDVRRCLTTDGRVAHLMYTWRGEPLSVFVLPRLLAGAGTAQRFVERFGHEAVVWSERGRTYVMLARGQPADLLPVLGYVRANAH